MMKKIILVLLVLSLCLVPVFADRMSAGVVGGYPEVGGEFDFDVNDNLDVYGQVNFDYIHTIWDFGAGADYELFAIDYEEARYGKIFPISVGGEALVTYMPKEEQGKRFAFSVLATVKAQLDFTLNGIPFTSFARVGGGVTTVEGTWGHIGTGKWYWAVNIDAGLLVRF